MIQKNKVISLTIIGLVLGGIIGSVADLEQANMVTLGVAGGVLGFLAGWIWNSRSGESDDSPSAESDDSPSDKSEE